MNCSLFGGEKHGKTWKDPIDTSMSSMFFWRWWNSSHPPARTHTHTHEKIRDTLRGLLRVVSTGYGKSLVADDTGSTTLFVVGLQSWPLKEAPFWTNLYFMGSRITRVFFINRNFAGKIGNQWEPGTPSPGTLKSFLRRCWILLQFLGDIDAWRFGVFLGLNGNHWSSRGTSLINGVFLVFILLSFSNRILQSCM